MSGPCLYRGKLDGVPWVVFATARTRRRAQVLCAEAVTDLIGTPGRLGEWERKDLGVTLADMFPLPADATEAWYNGSIDEPEWTDRLWCDEGGRCQCHDCAESRGEDGPTAQDVADAQGDDEYHRRVDEGEPLLPSERMAAELRP